MSQNPNAFSGTHRPLDPADLTDLHPSRQKLKTSTKTFAIVLLVLGILGLVTSLIAPLMALILPGIMESVADQDAQVKQAAEQMRSILNPFSLVMLALSFLISLALILGGIGTLRRSLSGARCLRYAAGVMVPLTLIQSAFGLYNLVANKGQMLKNFEDQMNRSGGQELPQGMETMAEVMFFFQIGLAIVVGLVFAALYFWAFLHMSKSSTMAQFVPPDGPSV